jgi:multiple sugar transport system ATP-binding protein
VADITLEHVTKEFGGGVKAVDDVSLAIRDGEFMVLVGPSGCGKSTLLRLIAGLEEGTAGGIAIGGRDVTDLPPRERDIAMVFQSYALYPHMTVRQNLGYGLKVRKTDKGEARRRVEEVAGMLHLDELLDRRPAALSGGQRQRVAMGRAIVREPKAFLMDEPLSNLDAKLRVSMRAQLAALHDRLGATTVYVTHDQVEAMTLGQRVAVMRDGRIQQVDTPTALYSAPANLFVAAFIGSPAMNLVHAEVDGDQVEFAGFRIPLDRERRPQRPVARLVLGVRPEAFEDAAFADPGLPQVDVTPRVIEELGSDVNVIFEVEAQPVQLEDVRQASEDEALLVAGVTLLTARVDARSAARVGVPMRLAVDPVRFHFFDADSGENLTSAPRALETPAPARARG